MRSELQDEEGKARESVGSQPMSSCHIKSGSLRLRLLPERNKLLFCLNHYHFWSLQYSRQTNIITNTSVNTNLSLGWFFLSSTRSFRYSWWDLLQICGVCFMTWPLNRDQMVYPKFPCKRTYNKSWSHPPEKQHTFSIWHAHLCVPYSGGAAAGTELLKSQTFLRAKCWPTSTEAIQVERALFW